MPAPQADVSSLRARTPLTRRLSVGYGVHCPVSGEGRVVAVVLMVVGIGVVGAVTASVATWILGRVEAERAERQVQPSDGVSPDMP